MMKKLRLIALLTALCVLLSCFTACKREDAENFLAGGITGIKNDPFSGTQLPNDSGTVADPTNQGVVDLTAEVSYTEEWPTLSPDAEFCAKQMDFSVELFRNVAQKSRCKNTLIAPASVLMALSMAANGADGKTAEEMLLVLGGFTVNQLNSYLGNWRNFLLNDPKSSLKIANSIWIRDIEGVEAKQEFLANNAKYYDAKVFKSPFNQIGVEKINQWVDQSTDGMIDSLVQELRSETMMVLINALAFDAQWKEPYQDRQVHKDFFTSLEGKKQTVKMMYSTESTYLEGEGVIGFLRPYAGGNYSFGALLPEEGTFEEYVANLSGEKLSAILDQKTTETVHARLPQFSNSFTVNLNDTLKGMGMPSAFQGGFEKMSNTDLLIGEFLHKTVIEVTQSGTRAAAVSSVSMDKYSMPSEDPKTVTLDRPFIYFILDNETGLPLFMGTVTSV